MHSGVEQIAEFTLEGRSEAGRSTITISVCDLETQFFIAS